MKHNSKQLVISFFATVFILGLITPVHAWSDIGVEYYDGIREVYGEWSENDNTALEEYVGLWAYYLEVEFNITGVDQSADVYKIRLDYDGTDGAESIQLWYRWGSSSSWTYCTTLSSPQDLYYTITDATNTLLQIQIRDNTRVFDFNRDQWDFGSEPELWMYWY